MIVDIVVEHRIANFVRYWMMKVLIVSEKFSDAIVRRMDHVHCSMMFHVLNAVMKDIVQYLMLIHLVVMF